MSENRALDSAAAIDDKSFTIIINGREYTVDTEEVSFDYIVDKAYPDGGRGDLISYTVLFYEGGGRPTEGGVDEGESVKIKDGTIFNVTRTDRS